MKKIAFLMLGVVAFLGMANRAVALEGGYVQGQAGYSGLTGSAANSFNSTDAVGLGVDLGLNVNPFVDAVFSFTYSNHGGLSLFAPFISADIHVLQVYDFDLTISAGPGFYLWSVSNYNETKFGVSGGGAIDVHITDNVKMGIGARYHSVFSSDAFASSFYTVMMRFGIMWKS
jgi:hypothetical protein